MGELTSCGIQAQDSRQRREQAGNKPGEPSRENSLTVRFNHGILVSEWEKAGYKRPGNMPGEQP